MIDWATAHWTAEQTVARIGIAQQGDAAVLDDSQTREYPFGWVFVYQSYWYMQTGNADFRLLDNLPFIVDRATGAVVEVRRPKDRFLSEYQAHWQSKWQGA